VALLTYLATSARWPMTQIADHLASLGEPATRVRAGATQDDGTGREGRFAGDMACAAGLRAASLRRIG